MAAPINDWNSPVVSREPSACGRCGLARHLHGRGEPFVWLRTGWVNLCSDYLFPSQEQILARMRDRRTWAGSVRWNTGVSRDR